MTQYAWEHRECLCGKRTGLFDQKDARDAEGEPEWEDVDITEFPEVST